MAQILISKALLTTWKKMSTSNDKLAIGNDPRTSYYKVSQAFKTKKTDPATYEAIKNFYDKRSEFLNEQKEIAESLNVA